MKKVLLALLTIHLALGSHAQDQQKEVPKGQYPKSAIFKAGSQPAFVKDRVALFDEQGNYRSDAGRLLNFEVDSLSHKTHYRSQQVINGIAVENAIYIQHVMNNKVVASNGIWLKHASPKIFTRPAITEKSALNIALKRINAALYKWQVASEEALLKNELRDNSATYFPKATLVYYSGETGADSSSLRLAFKFDIYAQKPLTRQYVFVDATNGSVLGTRTLIHPVNTPGTAYTAYSGQQTIQTEQNDGLYRLRETGRGHGIETYNLMKTSNYPIAVDFTNATTVWNNTNEAKDQYATDAHWGTEMTWDYFYYKFGRNSIDNAGYILRNYLHYTSDYNNAFWDGYRMTYGDGNSNNNYHPLTTLDICGHEISHGLTTFTSGLIYSGESGALNEGFSDIFGTMIENYARPAKWDWIIGGDYGGFRSMSNPNAYLQPDTYKGQFWDANEEVHTNSGVLNFWFYLLAMGGNGVNDIYCNYNVRGIGMEKAASIAFKTNTAYLFPTCNYADAARYSLMAAADLFGPSSDEVAQTASAWSAVGININATMPTVLASATTVCAGGSTRLSVTNASLNGARYWQWYTSKCGGDLAGTGAEMEVRPDSTTTYYVRGEGGCVSFGDCGSVTIEVSKPPVQPVVVASGPLSFCLGQNVTLRAPDGYAAYKWSDGSASATIIATKAGTYSVRVLNANGCESIASTPVLVQVSSAATTPLISMTGSTNNCVNGSVTLSSTEAFRYQWSTGATTQSITVNKAGNYSVTTTNEGGCAATSLAKEIKFTDGEAPVPTLPSLPDLHGECSATVVTFPTAMDNCTGPVTATTADPLSYTAQGTYIVHWTYADGNGNSVKQTQNVIVKDITPPAVISPSLTAGCGATGGIYTLPLATAKDNCGVVPSGFSYQVSGATIRSGTGADASGFFAQGTNTVTFTVTDINGNTAKASSEIIITPAVVATIPDVYAVQPGGQPNTLYIGYGPATITLTSKVTGGSGNYAYSWSNGSSSSSTIIKATSAGNYVYTLTVTDSKGCSITSSKTIHVVDVRCGNKNDKVSICKVVPGNSNQIASCVSENAVGAQLGTGSYLGACSLSAAGVAGVDLRTNELVEGDQLSISAWPNPSSVNFKLMITSSNLTPVRVDVIDLAGRLILSRNAVLPNSVIYFGENFKAGTYFIRASQNNVQVMMKATKISR